MADENRLEVRKVVENKITALQLNGIIDESFNGKHLAEGIKGTLIVDFSGIKRISSFGIREWLEFLKSVEDKCDQIYFIKCPSRIIDQFNMVANFGGSKGVLLSFFAPYHCDYCEADHSELIDVADYHDSIKDSKLPDKPCETCGNAEYLDEDPETFLSYLAQVPKPELDPEVGAFLSHRLKYKVSRSRQKLKIDMHVGEATYIRFTGDIDSTFQGRKLAEGIEGKAIFDMDGVGDITEDGLEIWKNMVKIMEETVEVVYLMGVNAAVLSRLLSIDWLVQGKVRIVDLYLPYTCTSCNTTLDMHLSVDEHFEVLKFATAPELKCPDCGGKSIAQIDGEVLSNFANIEKPDFPKNLVKFVEKARVEIKKVNTPQVSQASETSSSGGSLGIIAALMALLVIIAGGGYFLYTRVLSKKENVREKLEMVDNNPKPKPGWVTPSNKLKIENGVVTIVAFADEVDKPDQGIGEALGWALDLYVEHIADQISEKDQLWKTVVRGLYFQPREDILGRWRDAGNNKNRKAEIYRQIRDYHSSVGTSFRIAFGKDIQPSATYWEKFVRTTKIGETIFYRVWVKLEIPVNVTAKMVKSFSEHSEYEGATVVRFFPGLNWAFPKLARGLMVLSLSSKSRFNGILKVGYILAKLANDELLELKDFSSKFESLMKVQQEKGRCVILIHFNYWNSELKDPRNSSAEYTWKCPEKTQIKTIIKTVPGNGGNVKGFQGNIWDDPSR
ncbi:MAG: hypothetical protein JXR95_01665 [Deltaproteobacteria bacterium]|nr:hypothetical protein [Deltaproteobacteria bacterium]